MKIGHRVRTVRFPCGHWVSGCSCGAYMSMPYDDAATAMEQGSRHVDREVAKLAAAMRSP